jgi:hypothetical protein
VAEKIIIVTNTGGGDTTAPSAPMISGFSPDTDAAGDGVTSAHELTLTGTAEANSQVKIFDGAVQIGTTTTSAVGSWSFTTSTLPDGAHAFKATATDAAGNTSVASAVLSVEVATPVDTIAPNAPTIKGYSPDTNVKGDGLTKANQLTLTGAAEANSKVKMFDGSTQIGTATTDGSGGWSFTTATLLNGTHSFKATATDAAGNTSAASLVLSVKVDTQAPKAPSIKVKGHLAEFDVSSSGAVVQAKTVTLTGTAEEASVVSIFDGATKIGDATADANGGWSFTSGVMANGTHSFSAIAMDTAGNISGWSAVVTITTNGVVPNNDHNGDLTSDLLWTHDSGQLAVWDMAGSQQSDYHFLGSVGSDWRVVNTGDFNTDGHIDILWRHHTGAVAVWDIRDGQQSDYHFVGSVGNDWQVADAADFNGDGASDLLWRHESGQLAIWNMNGGQQSGYSFIGFVGSDWTLTDTGDFNGDGHTDILWRHASGAAAVWDINNAQQTDYHFLGAVGNDWRVVDTGDFNGDGRSDILWSHTGGQLAIWDMIDGQQADYHFLGSVGSDWKVADTGDYNGDGHTDILWRHTSGAAAVWEVHDGEQVGYQFLGNIGNDWHLS